MRQIEVGMEFENKANGTRMRVTYADAVHDRYRFDDIQCTWTRYGIQRDMMLVQSVAQPACKGAPCGMTLDEFYKPSTHVPAWRGGNQTDGHVYCSPACRDRAAKVVPVPSNEPPAHWEPGMLPDACRNGDCAHLDVRALNGPVDGQFYGEGLGKLLEEHAANGHTVAVGVDWGRDYREAKSPAPWKCAAAGQGCTTPTAGQAYAKREPSELCVACFDAHAWLLTYVSDQARKAKPRERLPAYSGALSAGLANVNRSPWPTVGRQVVSGDRAHVDVTRGAWEVDG